MKVGLSSTRHYNCCSVASQLKCLAVEELLLVEVVPKFQNNNYANLHLHVIILQDVFHVDNSLEWVEPTQLAFVILGACMAAIAVMILVSSILATGATRVEVYKSQVGRVGCSQNSFCPHMCEHWPHNNTTPHTAGTSCHA